jgi:hypothetical protein
MGLFKRDPRDPVGQNPTGRPRKSSSKKRRQAANKMDRDLKDTEWEGEGDGKSES